MTNFPYERDIPDGPNNPSEDQPNMLKNTNSTDSLLNVDHVSFSQPRGGQHRQVTLNNLGAGPGLKEGDGVLYAGLFNGQSWPVWQNALGSTTIVTRETSAIANGYVSLAGNILLQWGTVTFGGSTDHKTASVNFNIAFPNSCFVVVPQLQVASSGTTTASNTLAVRSISASSFVYVYNSSASNGTVLFPGFYWIAIGN